MKISFAITTHNETTSLLKLVESINKNKLQNDEIVILDDFSENKQTKEILKSCNNVSYRKFCGDYSVHKNYINSRCKGDYIFQIDGDETLSELLLRNIHKIIASNAVDLFWIPRINKVNGIKTEHLKKWKWSIDEHDRINYPDFQGRLYKNKKELMWKRAVHEVINGQKTQTKLPTNSNLDILHIKDIKTQIESNCRYDNMYNSDGTKKK
jgi:glycosyltransferase involved in cell wall biosynthesis